MSFIIRKPFQVASCWGSKLMMSSNIGHFRRGGGSGARSMSFLSNTAARSIPLQQRGRNNSRGGSGGKIPPYVFVGVGATSLVVASCYYAFLDEAPLTKRKRWIATSPEWERQLGDQEYKQLLESFRKQNVMILPMNHRASVTVQRVGSRIAQASFVLAKKYQLSNAIIESCQIPYTYTVVKSEMANAFVLPGNHVFVMTGLFKYVHNEDELAAVLGHEVAHNLARHAGEKVSGSVLINVLARLSLLVDPSGVIFAIFLPAASLFRELPNSRIQEMEADQIGIQLAAEACYDPRAAKKVFASMKEAADSGSSGSGSSSPPEFLSTHPSHDSRISNFDVWLPDAMNRFEGDYGGRCAMARRAMAQARVHAAMRHHDGSSSSSSNNSSNSSSSSQNSDWHG